MNIGVYKLTANEIVLENDYPVYQGYVYIFDMVFSRSPLTGTVADLKALGAKEIRRCDLFDHDDAKIGDKISN